MLASPSLARWLALAFGVVGLVYLVFHGQPPTEPLIGGLRDGSLLPPDAVADAPITTSGIGVVPQPSPPEAEHAEGEVVDGTESGHIPGYDGPLISSHGGSIPLERSKIVKLTMLYYDNVTADTEAYERAMQSHVPHDEKFGYDHFILRRGLVEGLWTKQAQILQILIRELAKPPEERYEWIFWHDADCVLMNHNVPLELFLPPSGWEHIHWLVANDLSGLNAGIYFIRVHEWAVHFMAASLSYPVYNPERWLIHDEQTAQDLLLREERWSNHTMHMPQRWFNAYHNFGRDSDIPPEWDWINGYAEPGDLLVHLPGTGQFRSNLMDDLLETKREKPDEYCPPLEQTSYEADVKAFWENEAQKEREVQSTFWRHYKLLHTTGSEQDKLRDKAVETAKAGMVGWPEDKLEEEVRRVKEDWKPLKITALREAEVAAVQEGKIYLNEP